MHKIWHTCGILAPRSWYCRGFFKKLTNSKISTLASSQPATSLNRTPMLPLTILALVSLMLKGFPRPLPPRPPPIGPCRVAKSKNPTSSKVGRIVKRSVLWGERWESTWTHPVHIKITSIWFGPQINFSPVAFTGVEYRYSLCGVQTHVLLGHLQVMLEWVNTADVEPQKALETHKNMQHSINVYVT